MKTRNRQIPYVFIALVIVTIVLVEFQSRILHTSIQIDNVLQIQKTTLNAFYSRRVHESVGKYTAVVYENVMLLNNGTTILFRKSPDITEREWKLPEMSHYFRSEKGNDEHLNVIVIESDDRNYPFCTFSDTNDENSLRNVAAQGIAVLFHSRYPRNPWHFLHDALFPIIHTLEFYSGFQLQKKGQHLEWKERKKTALLVMDEKVFKHGQSFNPFLFDYIAAHRNHVSKVDGICWKKLVIGLSNSVDFYAKQENRKKLRTQQIRIVQKWRMWLYPLLQQEEMRMKRNIPIDKWIENIDKFNPFIKPLPVKLEKPLPWQNDFIPLDALQDPISDKSPIILILLREKRRRLLNLQELVALAQKRQFQVVTLDPSRITLYNMVALMQRVHVVIGIHGAALMNTLFLSQQACVVQLVPFGWKNSLKPDIYRRLIQASVQGLNMNNGTRVNYLEWHNTLSQNAWMPHQWKLPNNDSNQTFYHPSPHDHFPIIPEGPWMAQDTTVDIPSIDRDIFAILQEVKF